uniref:Rx N-terminal domain-containing protein n=1 Tax=Oryza glumipatula TaxID=40148 RepID=A0A0E0BJ22_9ORYZ
MELVVGASEATMKALLGKLGNLFAQEYALIRGVRGDIQYISDEMASIHAFLTNLSSSGNDDDHDAQTKDWMKQVRDIAYDMEDSVDDFAHLLRHDPRGDGCLIEVYRTLYEIYTCRPRRDIAAKLAELKNRAQQVGERRLRYGVVLNPMPPQREARNGATQVGNQTTGENQVAGRRLITVKEPIGVARAIEKLEAWMKSRSHKNRGVLAIHGFGGGGKSTIAAALYRKHGQKFDCRAWVTMPQKFDDRAVLRSILSQVMLPATASGGGDRRQRGGSRHAKIETMSQEQLIKGLKNHLQNKSFE